MIFDMVIYVTLIRNGMHSTTKELSFPLLMCFNVFNFG